MFIKPQFFLLITHLYSFCRFLLLKYKAHINVEVVGSVGAIKYLFKYITKGPDRVMVEKDFRSKEEIDHDEITQHINASWYVYFYKFFKLIQNVSITASNLFISSNGDTNYS